MCARHMHMMTDSHTIPSHNTIQNNCSIDAHCESLGLFSYPSGRYANTVLIASHSWDNTSWEFPGSKNFLLARIDYLRMICLWRVISRGDDRNWTVARYFTVFAHSSRKAHCSYSLKFSVVKNLLRNRSLSNCSLLDSRFARSCSTCPLQRSKYTEGVARCMRRYIVVQRLGLSTLC